VIVKRNIGGSDVRYIEQLQPQFEHDGDIEDAFFVDSGLTYEGVSATNICGLTHLNGKTVSILADGLIQNQKVVAGGCVILDTAATKAHIGLPYASTLQTMRYVGNSNLGTLQGQEKRINSIVLRLENAFKFDYGHTTTGTLNTKTYTSLFTGDVKLEMPLGVNKEGYIAIVNDDPVPITVTAIVSEVNFP